MKAEGRGVARENFNFPAFAANMHLSFSPTACFTFAMQKLVSLEKIDIYGGTQTRVATNDQAIIAYAEAMQEGAEFPPIVVYFDGAQYWLADGFHRYLAAKRNGLEALAADIHEGGRTDALLHALGANANNGLFRSVDDKRNAVEIALEEWWDKSNRQIADICNVSSGLVGKARKTSGRPLPETVTGRDGKQYPSAIEREPRGESGSSGGGSGRPSKKNANAIDIAGGSLREIEAESRKMIREGEIDPRELDNIDSADATDYAHAAIRLLNKMNRLDPKFGRAVELVEQWLAQQAGSEK